jgi:hypothetical protein
MKYLLVLLLLSGCARKPLTHEVRFDVAGIDTDRATVSVSNQHGDVQQIDAFLPWFKTLTIKEGESIHVSAQNKRDSGTVVLFILADGKIRKTQQSTGPYVVVASAYRCCD